MLQLLKATRSKACVSPGSATTIRNLNTAGELTPHSLKPEKAHMQ